MTNRNIWNQITTSLESTLSKSEINTWFSSTSLIKLDKDRAVIEVPNRFVASWLSDNYIDKIHLSFKENLNYFPEILFIYSGSKPAEETPEYKTQKKSRVVLNHQLNPSLTFSNFITAKSNRFAYSLALDVADRPAEDYNPLYIFSKPSSGKTHLLNAIGNKILTHNPSAKVIYTSLDQLSSEFSIARKNRKLSKFRQNYRNLEILFIYSGSKPAEETPEYKTQKKSRVVLNHQLNSSLTFSNFITAKSNR
ncbi:MAG: ATP-binding protein, partial [Deltaproteobacteria bacterium]|nr:ATP-binding protein [Deltaproteobacteria bacterium]